MPTIELPVAGMTCRACETKISRALSKVPGVATATASSRRGVATVEASGPISRSGLVAAVRHAGYEVGASDRPWLTRDRRIWRDVAVAAAVLAVIALAASAAGLTDLAGRAGGMAGSGGLLVVLVLGFAAGLSTCMALVGGLLLAVSARFAEHRPDLTGAQKLRPHLAFNAGRVVGFAVLGAAAGAVGSALTLSARLVAVAMIAVSLVMGAVGLKLTAVSPRLSGGGFALPAGLSRLLRLDRVGDRYSDRTALLLGAGSFFLPCGFTQAVQVYALSTGSPVQAGVVMAVFALGTTPGLLSLGGLTAAVRGASAERFFRFAGVLVLAFAVINVNGALGVLAPGLFATVAAGTTLSANVTLDGDVQVLRTTQVANGYEPADATVYAGREVRWEMDSTALTCAATIYAPDLGIEATLEPGLNVFTFTPREPGTLRYSCFMGMYHGSITVIEEPAPADPQA